MPINRPDEVMARNRRIREVRFIYAPSCGSLRKTMSMRSTVSALTSTAPPPSDGARLSSEPMDYQTRCKSLCLTICMNSNLGEALY